MIDPSIIDALVASGCSAEQLAAAMKADAAIEMAKLEAKRAKGRARFHRWKETHSNADKRSQTLAADSNALTGGDARVEDKTSNLEIEPQKEEKKETRRATRLPSDWTLPFEWRADAIKAGLPEYRIDTEALNMLDWSLSSPNGAKLDWRASWRTWCRRAAKDLPRAGPGPGKPKTAADFLLSETMDRVNGHDGPQTSSWPDAGEFPGVAVAGSTRRLGVPDRH